MKKTKQHNAHCEAAHLKTKSPGPPLSVPKHILSAHILLLNLSNTKGKSIAATLSLPLLVVLVQKSPARFL